MSAPAIALRNIRRRFGSVLANDDVSLDLAPGEIHALVGENGAGKTTLMRVLYGMLSPDGGVITSDGRPVSFRSSADAMRAGLGMVHQHFMLVDALTVAQNVTLGREPGAFLGLLSRGRAEREVAELASSVGLPVPPAARISTVSVGVQQRVEILRALYHGARVLILDEPTAVLTPQEVDDLFTALRALQARGVTIVLITHKLSEVRALAQRVTVLRGGRVVASGATADFTMEALAELMVGRTLSALRARAQTNPQVPLLEVRLLDVNDDRSLPAVKKLSFDVHGGEIVGIAGVEGNGQHELVESLAGLRSFVHGDVAIAGRRLSGRSAAEHRAAGMAHIPADRLRRGLVPEMTVAENLSLGFQRSPELGQGPFLPPAALAERAEPLLEQYDVRPPDPELRARQLSGGNQQKLIVARELSRAAQVIVAAQPTRGVDLGAIDAIHRRLLAERQAGRAILLVSSDLGEILALSDRILVMYEGRLVHETTPATTDERTLGLYMAGRRPGETA